MFGRVNTLLRRTPSTLAPSVQALFAKPAVEESLETYLADEFQSFVRGYSGVLIGATIVSLGATFAISELFAWASSSELLKFFFPALSGSGKSTIASWHVTRLAASVATWVLYFYAARIARRRANHRPFDVATTQRVFFVTERTRTICSLWTLGCGLKIVGLWVCENADFRWFP